MILGRASVVTGFIAITVFDEIIMFYRDMILYLSSIIVESLVLDQNQFLESWYNCYIHVMIKTTDQKENLILPHTLYPPSDQYIILLRT